MKRIIHLAEPRGFCAGVRRALTLVEEALIQYKRPIYVFNSIVHNKIIVNELRQRGIIFVNSLTMVPRGAVLIFSAHGVSRQIENAAYNLDLQVIDATCPLVKKIHDKARQYYEAGERIILIGHRSHPEIIGTLGQIDNQAEVVENIAEVEALQVDKRRTVCLTQTTLSIYDTADIMRALYKQFPGIDRSGTDICYATKERQEAVARLTDDCDLVLIVGSKNSSNSNRMRETALRRGTPAYMIDRAAEVSATMLDGIGSIGISAGASAPEYLVTELVEFLRQRGWEMAE